jgi:hypothetical protein
MKYFVTANILNRVSMIFIVINLISIFFVMPSLREYFYPWICFITYVIYYLRDKGSKFSYAIGVLMFIPIIFLPSFYEAFLTFTAFGAAIYYIRTYRAKLDFYLTLNNFKREYRIIVFATLVALIMIGSNKINEHVATYMFINLITYTVILRTTRLLEHRDGDEKINKVNAIYGVASGITAIIISVNEVREMIGKLLYLAYLAVLKIFNFLIMAFIYVFGNAIDKFFGWISKYAGLGEFPMGGTIGEPETEYVNQNKPLFLEWLDSPFVQILGQLLILLFILFIVYRVLKKYWLDRAVDCHNDQFVEEKESIISEGSLRRRGFISRLSEALRTKTIEEQIRSYYIRFLRNLKSKGVEINENNTSLDINKKSHHIYEKRVLDEIREIYIVIRYGEKKSDRATSKKFAEMIKKGDKV